MNPLNPLKLYLLPEKLRQTKGLLFSLSQFLWQEVKSETIVVLYMSSSFWLLRVESRDFSQAEKERTAWKAAQIHKMTTISNLKNNLGQF